MAEAAHTTSASSSLSARPGKVIQVCL